jgi:tetratricopeptide (TPR) repeat protein
VIRSAIARGADCKAFFYVSLFGLVVLASCNRAEQPTRAPLAAAAPAAELESVEPPATTVDSTALPDEAKQIVVQLATDFPASAEADFACGQIFRLYGQSDAAIASCERCLERDAQFVLAHEQIALLEMNRGEFEQAVEHLREACKMAPELPEARLHLGKALCQLGKFQDAIEPLQQQTRLQPKNTEAWFRLGQAYLEMEQPEQAKQAFQSAIDAFADCAPAWFGMAQALDRLGDKEKAREARERFLQLDHALTAADRNRRRRVDDFAGLDNNELPQSYAVAASVYAFHGQATQAQAYWRKAIELNPADIASRQALGQSLARSNHPEKALEVFQELLKIQPRQPEHLLVIASLHEQLQDVAAAERAYGRAMELAPLDARPVAGLARLLAATGKRLPEAQRLMERVIQLQPTAESFFFLSTLCRANQDRGGEKAALREAQRLDPQNPQYAAAAGVLEKE